MARKRARTPEGEFKGDNPTTPDVNEAWVEETPATPESAAPAEIEQIAPDAEPVEAAPVQTKEEIETDVRKKLAKKTESENPFVPQNHAQLEVEAKQIAQEKGFELNRGTSIGARLMARRRLG